MLDLDASLQELKEICTLRSGILKTENDLARYQWIIDTVKPEVIIETGFAFGGSCKWFAERVPLVISIDQNPEYLKSVTDLPDNVITVLGKSVDVFERVRDF